MQLPEPPLPNNTLVQRVDDVVSLASATAVALFEKDDTVQSLLQQADEGLYEAKRSGRNSIVITA